MKEECKHELEFVKETELGQELKCKVCDEGRLRLAGHFNNLDMPDLISNERYNNIKIQEKQECKHDMRTIKEDRYGKSLECSKCGIQRLRIENSIDFGIGMPTPKGLLEVYKGDDE